MNNLKIKELREAHNLSQSQLASELGVTRQTISLIEKGKRHGTTDMLRKLSNFFNVPADYLLNDEATTMKNPKYVASSYAILIPAKVVEDRRLRSNSKLLYGEIYSALNVQGICTTSNATFSKKLGLTVNTLQQCLKELETYGYIHREMVQDEVTGVVTRAITAGASGTSHFGILRSNPNVRI